MSEEILNKTHHFISVEIAITTDFDADEYVQWFEAQDNPVAKIPADSHTWYIYFAPIPCQDVNTTIRKFCEMIRELPPNVRRVWDEAAHREFYAGYHEGGEACVFTEYLEPQTLKAAADLDAGIRFVLYQAPPTNGN